METRLLTPPTADFEEAGRLSQLLSFDVVTLIVIVVVAGIGAVIISRLLNGSWTGE